MNVKKAKELYQQARQQLDQQQLNAALKQIEATAKAGHHETFFYKSLSKEDIKVLKKAGFKIEHKPASEKMIGSTRYLYAAHYVISGWKK